MSGDLHARDKRYSWHPYTQHGLETSFLGVTGAEGNKLKLDDGREVIDGISSWWATLHGHGHPKLIEAMTEQARSLDHVLFAGCTQEPAVQLAEELAAATPGALTRSFFSDDGSTAVEVALKIALQSWVLRGQPQRKTFLALEGGYHGDTFGAMSVGDPDPFFLPFAPLLFEAVRVPAELGALEAALEELGDRCAGCVRPARARAAAVRRSASTLIFSARSSAAASSRSTVTSRSTERSTEHFHRCLPTGNSPAMELIYA